MLLFLYSLRFLASCFLEPLPEDISFRIESCCSLTLLKTCCDDCNLDSVTEILVIALACDDKSIICTAFRDDLNDILILLKGKVITTCKIDENGLRTVN